MFKRDGAGQFCTRSATNSRLTMFIFTIQVQKYETAYKQKKNIDEEKRKHV